MTKIDADYPLMDCASYLHNPYGYPTKVEQAAILCFRRTPRFVEGYDVTEHLDEVILRHFPSLDALYHTGLVACFQELRQDVIDNHLIGLMLIGADRNAPNKVYYRYNQVSGTELTLSRQSICYHLLKEFTPEQIDELCRKTPNFEIYMNG